MTGRGNMNMQDVLRMSDLNKVSGTIDDMHGQ